MPVQATPSMIAPCGMNCGICLAYLRDKNKCAGCWGENTQTAHFSTRCAIRNCEFIRETESKYCYGCPKFPCKRLKQLDKRYRLRYQMSMIENLGVIEKSGLESFLQKELNRWRCHSCGGTICVHTGYCLPCKKLKNPAEKSIKS